MALYTCRSADVYQVNMKILIGYVLQVCIEAYQLTDHELSGIDHPLDFAST